MERKEYLDKATSKIFNYKAKKEVGQELSAHIDDRRESFAHIESDEQSAEERAVESMGDAELIYEELGELHNNFYNPVFDIIYTVILGGAMAGLYYLLDKFVVGDPGVASLMLSALFLPLFFVMLYIALTVKRQSNIPVVFAIIQIGGMGAYSYFVLNWLNQQFCGSFGRLWAFITSLRLNPMSKYAPKKQVYIWVGIICVLLLLGIINTIIFRVKKGMCQNTRLDNKIKKVTVSFYRYFSFVFLAVAVFFGVKCYIDSNTMYKQYTELYNTAVEISEKCSTVDELNEYMKNCKLDFEAQTDSYSNITGYSYSRYYTDLTVTVDQSDVNELVEEYKRDMQELIDGEYGKYLGKYLTKSELEKMYKEYEEKVMAEKVEFSVNLSVSTDGFQKNFDSLTLSRFYLSDKERESFESFVPFDAEIGKSYELYKTLPPIKLSFYKDHHALLDNNYNFSYLIKDGGFKYQEDRKANRVDKDLSGYFEYRDFVMSTVNDNTKISQKQLAEKTNATLELPKMSREEYENSVNTLGSYFDSVKDDMVGIYDYSVKYRINEPWAEGDWYYLAIGSPVGMVMFYSPEGILETKYIDKTLQYSNYSYDPLKKVSVMGGYFDRLGNFYTQAERTPYYTENGDKLFFYNHKTDSGDTSVGNISTYYITNRTNIYYEAERCFIDENGYLCYDKAGAIKSDDNGKYKDSSGKVYTKAVETSWDRDGSILVQNEKNSSSFSLFEY